MKYKILFIALLFIGTINSSAQLTKTKVKITMKNGDQKFGFAKRHNKELFLYKTRKRKNKDREIIPISNIKTFSMAFQEGYKNFEFVQNSRTGKYKLLLLLIDGDYKLYKSFPSQNMSQINNEIDKSIVMSKDGGKTYILFKNFRREAKRLFADCEAVIKGLDEKYFGRLDLGEMILIYNDGCIDVPEDIKAPVVVKEPEPVKEIVVKKTVVKAEEPTIVKEVVEKEPEVVQEVKIVRNRLVVNINPIYFSLNKAEIREDALDELKKVVDLMHRNPTLRIEVGSHTDSRGSDAYNLDLSSQRANASVNYILNQGIDLNRISAKGFGETQPIVFCETEDSCTELDHAKNRRTEFVILNPEVMGY
ncbi:MAG: OmpA family protein [Flavobacteriaceae bacterium]